MANFKLKNFLMGVGLVAIPSLIAYHFVVRRRKAKSSLRSEGYPKKETIVVTKRRVRVLYGTVTGTARAFAHNLVERLNELGENGVEASAIDLRDYNEDVLVKEDIAFVIACTWTDGKAPEGCGHLFEFLNDFAHDFRVSKDHFSKLTFSCFGLGSANYGKNYAKVALDAHEHLEHLGATPLAPVARGDDQSDLEDQFELWAAEMVKSIAKLANVRGTKNTGGKGKGQRKGQVPPNMPKLSGAEKAELLKQRKQSKMKTLERTTRGNSFQRQQLALGKGKAGKVRRVGEEEANEEIGKLRIRDHKGRDAAVV